MLFAKYRIISVFLLLIVAVANAQVENIFYFANPDQEERFITLLGELRCLVCQNQSLSESNSPLAQDLKQEIYRQVVMGLTDNQIKSYLVNRYGDYILFRPAMNETTLLLWLGPLIFLVGGFGILLVSMKKSQRHYVVNKV